jgi:hypothetical protein
MALIVLTASAGGNGVSSGKAEDTGWFLSPGVLLGMNSTRSFDAAAELSVFTGRRFLLLGAALGSSVHTHSLELETAVAIHGELHGVFLGANPGMVWDRDPGQSRLGFQGTLWVWPLIQCGHACILPVPIPYFRLRLFSEGENGWIAGLALKLPWPISGAD